MKWDFIFCRPSIFVNLGFYLPHTVPCAVPPASFRRDTIGHGARGIDSKPECALAVVVRIETDGDFIRFNVIVSPD